MKSFTLSHSRQCCSICSGVDGRLFLYGTAFFLAASFSAPLVSSMSNSDLIFICWLRRAAFNFRVRLVWLPLFIMLRTALWDPPARTDRIGLEPSAYCCPLSSIGLNETEFLPPVTFTWSFRLGAGSVFCSFCIIPSRFIRPSGNGCFESFLLARNTFLPLNCPIIGESSDKPVSSLSASL